LQCIESCNRTLQCHVRSVKAMCTKIRHCYAFLTSLLPELEALSKVETCFDKPQGFLSLDLTVEWTFLKYSL